jgi:hypothetical protein
VRQTSADKRSSLSNMDETLDKTTLSTISLLEARLLRVEHLLFGASSSPSRPPAVPAIATLSDLERRFTHLLSRFRVYAELLKICRHYGNLHTYPQLLTNQSNQTTPTQPSSTQPQQQTPSSHQPNSPSPPCGAPSSPLPRPTQQPHQHSRPQLRSLTVPSQTRPPAPH